MMCCLMIAPFTQSNQSTVAMSKLPGPIELQEGICKPGILPQLLGTPRKVAVALLGSTASSA